MRNQKAQFGELSPRPMPHPHPSLLKYVRVTVSYSSDKMDIVLTTLPIQCDRGLLFLSGPKWVCLNIHQDTDTKTDV